MQTGTTVMAKPLWVPMSEEERKGHVDSLLRHLQRVDELEADLGAYQKKKRGDIAEELKEVQRLRRVLADDGKQMTLADAKIDDVPVPTPAEATAALAEVAKRAEPRWHKDGKLCTSDTCKRRHVPEMALRNAGIEPEQPSTETPAETTPTAEEAPATCNGCGTPLKAGEVVKKLGLCETCQVQKPGEDPLAGTPQAASAPVDGETKPADGETETPSDETNEASGEPEGEDPRPRCSACGDVLTADEVEKGLGLDQKCIDAAGGDSETRADESEPVAEPETEETPALGGEAGA